MSIHYRAHTTVLYLASCSALTVSEQSAAHADLDADVCATLLFHVTLLLVLAVSDTHNTALHTHRCAHSADIQSTGFCESPLYTGAHSL
jgi:hypothetical protein